MGTRGLTHLKTTPLYREASQGVCRKYRSNASRGSIPYGLYQIPQSSNCHRTRGASRQGC